MARPPEHLLDLACYSYRVEIPTRFDDIDSMDHANNVASTAYIDVGGNVQPESAPHYSVTATRTPRPPGALAAGTCARLAVIGPVADAIAAVRPGEVVL